jgi:hypothetical protein
MSPFDRDIERRLAVLVGGVDGDSALQQRRHHVVIATVDRSV